jgi:hypothetical protein
MSTSKLYFKNMNFCLIRYCCDLGAKRVLVLVDIIRKHGGTIEKDLDDDDDDDYVCSKLKKTYI